MAIKYDHIKVETKWQAAWLKQNIYKATVNRSEKNKRYVLDMFPYPSASSMHVGHLEGYVGTDILSRYLRMKGFSVLHPMGWDAFGLPAENYAIKTGIHPDKSTHDNIKTFKRQLEISGMSYDWSREIDTSSPEFYKWTQWLFILMFKNGLAYKKKSPVNWCPKDETVLANEQVIEGKCERCDTPVIQKDLDQWFFKITEYADRLVSGLDGINWPSEVKVQQKNWIGRKEGINITYDIDGYSQKITVFTTAPVNFGASFIVVAPEYAEENLMTFIPSENQKEVSDYLKTSLKETELERTSASEKTGIFTGLYAINHVNGKKMPVWVTDFVLANVGTGAVQGCPGHDKRDFLFAKKFGIDIPRVIVGEDGYDGPIEKESQVVEHGMKGKFVNSDFLNGLDFEDGLQKTMDYFEKKGWGKRVVTYHLRDWLISRQRYWGCPIPMIYCKDCGWNPVHDNDLPVLLPSDVDFLPHGQSPIATSKTFQKDVKCPNCGKKARREVDTMDTYVDSSWYFIRFTDPNNKKEFAGLENIKHWLPVDDYVGGGHVVQHLLFARFFWKVLYDQGLIDKSLGDEPFLKLRAPGWILGSDSRKMSKRWGNVVTPDDIIPKFGADTLRVYEMFMGPFDVMKPWSTSGVEGANRFLGRVWRLYQEKPKAKVSAEVLAKLHQTIKKVGEDIESYKFNTAISSLMELVNTIQEHGADLETLKNLALLLAPFAPHMMEEVWVEYIHMTFSIHKAQWPSYEAKYIVQKEVTVIVQINGKVRTQITLDGRTSKIKEKVESEARKDAKIAKYLDGCEIKNIIFVSGKLLNFVTK
jgi:leucyl-tRNA synthetase